MIYAVKGDLEVTIGETVSRAGAGSVLDFACGTPHAFHHVGDTRAVVTTGAGFEAFFEKPPVTSSRAAASGRAGTALRALRNEHPGPLRRRLESVRYEELQTVKLWDCLARSRRVTGLSSGCISFMNPCDLHLRLEP